MRLTWRDALTATLAVVVLLVYAGHVAAWALPLVDDTRGATLLLGAVGFAMCIVGGSSSTVARKDAFLVPASILGGAAALLLIAGLISGWELVVPALTADILVLWFVATMRHVISTGEPTAIQSSTR